MLFTPCYQLRHNSKKATVTAFIITQFIPIHKIGHKRMESPQVYQAMACGDSIRSVLAESWKFSLISYDMEFFPRVFFSLKPVAKNGDAKPLLWLRRRASAVWVFFAMVYTLNCLKNQSFFEIVVIRRTSIEKQYKINLTCFSTKLSSNPAPNDPFWQSQFRRWFILIPTMLLDQPKLLVMGICIKGRHTRPPLDDL